MTDSRAAFPKRFLWGAATAAHQVEGGNHNQWTVWELENAKARAAQARYHYDEFPGWERVQSEASLPDTYVSGALGDHYSRYREDFDFLDTLNMNAYRFSVEWSRVEPQEGAWNAGAIAHYKAYVNELRRRNIEPIITLFHFTLPVWFAQKGGFEHRANVKYFVRFAEKIMGEIGNGVRFIVTINEPEVYAHESYVMQEWPPNRRSHIIAVRVAHNLAVAHRRTVKALKKMNTRYRIGISKNSIFFYPGDSAWLSRVSAQLFQFFQDDFFIRQFIRHSDFLGVNYYQSLRVFGYRVHNPENQPHSDVNWPLAPRDLQYVLERLHRRYKKPLLVTENGLADATDQHRKWWLQETILAMREAMGHGVNLIGYLHWSLMDNFEWAHGKWPRFGLVAVDYRTGKRSLRPSAVWFGGVIKKLRRL